MQHPIHHRRRPTARRGFNLVELLAALAITAALLTSTMVALDASFMAYQSTTELASTHTIGRLVLHRMLTMIRSGEDFGPFPLSPTQIVIESDFIQFRTPDDDIIELHWVEDEEALYIILDPGTAFEEQYLLLEGVVAQYDGGGDLVHPFKLEYISGAQLYRATIDMMIIPDDNMSVQLDGDWVDNIRLVASAMPRTAAFRD